MFKKNDLVLLAVSGIAAFALLYWAFDYSVLTALLWTLGYSVLALALMYYKSKRSS